MSRRAFVPVLLAAALAACTTPPKSVSPIPLQEGRIDVANGVLGNNGGAIVSNNGGKLVANNAGSLAGVVMGPAGLIANNAASYHLHALAPTKPIAEAVVTVVDAAGASIAVEQSITDERGRYKILRLRPSLPVIFVRASYTEAGQAITLYAAVNAPRARGTLVASIDPASTLVAKKLITMAGLNAVNAAAINAETLNVMAQQLAPVVSGAIATQVAAAEPAVAAAVFDKLLADNPSLELALTDMATRAGTPTLVAPTPARAQAAPPPLPEALAEPAPAPSKGPAIKVTSTDALPTPAPAPTGPADPFTASSGTTSPTPSPAGATPTPGPGATPTPGPGATPTPAPTPTPGPGATPTPAPTPTPHPTPTPTPGNTPTPGPTPTPVPTPTPAPTATPTPAGPATVRTLGILTGTESMGVPFGANSVYLPDGLSGIQIGSLATPASDLATQLYDTQLDDGLRGVAFDGSNGYYLGADAIYGPNGLKVEAPELADCNRFAVIGNNAYATSLSRHVIYQVPLAGGAIHILAGEDGTADMVDGPGAVARFNQPYGILAAGGALYVADSHNHRIVRVTVDGTVTTVAGGTYGPADGTGAQAQFQHPDAITIDDRGILYVVDEEGNRVRRIAFQSGQAVVTTVSGTGANGHKDGTTNATFSMPTTIGWGKVGGTPVLFVGDYSDGRLRLVTNF